MSQMGQFQFDEILQTLTGNVGDIVHPQVGNINIIGAGGASVSGNNLTGTLTISTTAGVALTFTTDSGVATPIAANLRILGGNNLNSAGATDTVTVHLDDSIILPITSSDGLAGLYSLGATRFMHGRGTLNTFLGEAAGTLSLTTATATNNVGLGANCLTSVATSSYSTAAGSSSLTSLTGGVGNTCYGALSGGYLLTGSGNLFLGRLSGTAYIGSESDNICVANIGVVGTSNKAYYGTYGTGSGQVDTSTIAGHVHATNALTVDLGDLTVTAGNGYINAITNDAVGPELNLRKSRGVGVPAVLAGDELGTITFAGHDGSGYEIAALIMSNVSGTIGADRVAGNLEFWTHPDTVGAAVKRMELKTTGEVEILTPDSGTALKVNGTMYVTGIAAVTTSNTKIVTVDSTSGQVGAVTNVPAANGGSFIWSEVTGTTQAAAVMNGYIANNAALVTITLPATAAVGERVAIVGEGTGLWRLAQNSGQTVHYGSIDTTAGAGGYLEATVRYDCVEVICITANTDWVVRSSVGSITIV